MNSSLPMPVPSAWMSTRSSLWPRILSKRAFSTFRTLPLRGRMAWVARWRPCLARAAGGIALHQEDLAEGRILLLAVRQLAGQAAAVQGALAAGQLAGLAGGLPGPGGLDGLLQDGLGLPGVLLEERGELLVDDGLDDALHLAGDEPVLGLAGKLGIRDLGTQIPPSGPRGHPRPRGSPWRSSAGCSSRRRLLMTRVMAARKPSRCAPPSRLRMLFVKQ